jgi:hypothetical protein
MLRKKHMVRLCSGLSLFLIICHFNCSGYIGSNERVLNEQDRNFAIRTSDHKVPIHVLLLLLVAPRVDKNVNIVKFRL